MVIKEVIIGGNWSLMLSGSFGIWCGICFSYFILGVRRVRVEGK